MGYLEELEERLRREREAATAAPSTLSTIKEETKDIAPEEEPSGFNLGAITSFGTNMFSDKPDGGKGLLTRMREADEAAKQNVEDAKIAEAASRYGVKKDDEGNFQQSSTKDRIIGQAISRSGQAFGYVEDFYSPISGTLAYLLSSPYDNYDDLGEGGGVLGALQGIQEFGGDVLVGGANLLTDTPLTEDEERTARYAGGEAIFEAGTLGFGKGISSLGKVKNLVKRTKNIEDINIEISRHIQDFNKSAGVFNKSRDTSQLVKELQNLHIGAKEGAVTDLHIKDVQNKFGLIDMDFFTKTLEEATTKKAIGKRATGNMFDGYYKKTKSKAIDGVIKKLDELGFSPELPKKTINKIKRATGYDLKTVDEAISIRDSFNKAEPTKLFSELYNYQKLKRTDYNEIKGTKDLDVKGEMLKILKDENLVEVKKNTDFLHSFQLTAKGKKFIEGTDLPQVAKDDLINIGVAEHPKYLWEGITGDAIKKADITRKNLSRGTELRELGKLNFERVTGKAGKTNDLDIINTMYKIDERYGLNMKNQIDNVYDGVTGAVDSTRLAKAIETIESTDNLLLFKNVKPRPTKFKNLTTQLGYSQKLNKTLFDEGKRLTKIEYEGKITDLKIEHALAKKKIIKRSKIKGDTAKGKLIELNERFRAKLMDINARAGKIKEVKRLLLEQFKVLSKNKSFAGSVPDVAFKELVKKSGIVLADTPAKLNKAVSSIYRAITIEYANGLMSEIKSQLNIPKPGRVLKKKHTYSIEEIEQLITAKELFAKAYKGDIPIQDMEWLLKEIEVLKTKGVEKAKAFKADQAKKTNGIISQIKKEGIKHLEGQKNIILKDEASFLEKVGKGIMSINNETTFIPRLIAKIFNKDGVAYNYLINKTNAAYDKFDLFFTNKTTMVMEDLTNLFGDDVKDFGEYIFALNKKYDSKGVVHYEGFERIINDKLSSAHKPRTTKPKFDEVPDDFPLSQAQWDYKIKDGLLLKDSKLGEIMEQANTSKYKKATALWNSYNGLVGNKVNDIVERNEGYSLNFRENYMTFKRLNGVEESIDMEFGSPKQLDNFISDTFLKETIKNVKGYNYEYNPLNILASSGRQQAYYVYMKEIYDQNRRIIRGQSEGLKGLDVKTIESKLDGNQYKLIDSKGNELEFKGVDGDGNIITGDGIIINIDDARLQSKGGIKENLSPEGVKYIDEYMDTLARGGHFADTATERMVTTIVNQANVLPLLGNVSVVLKQGLSLVDGMGVVGTKPIFDAVKDLGGNPSIYNNLNKIDAVASRGGGDWLLKEQKPGKGVMGKAYSKYKSILTAPMKGADQYVYSTIWYGAYKDYMIKNGLTQAGKPIKSFDNARGIIAATDAANRTASTANPLWMPSVYKNAYAKSFFGIMTTQMNRVEEFSHEFPNELKRGEYGRAIERATWFFSSNVAEIAVTYGVGKFLFDIGATDYDKYGEDFSKNIFTAQSLYRATLGQTFLGTKADSIVQFGMTGLSPVLSLGDKVSRDLSTIWDGKSEGGIDAINHMFGGKFTDQITKIATD